MARVSAYEAQLREACQLVARQAGAREWELAYQSRSGSPTQPWLGPDIGERLRAQESRAVVVAPIGFISDHMEVLYDLDVEARALAETLGITMVRAGTAGVHPAFVHMVRELVAERMPDRAAPDVCPAGCCPRTEARQVVTP
jgi:ferrochelatase